MVSRAGNSGVWDDCYGSQSPVDPGAARIQLGVGKGWSAPVHASPQGFHTPRTGWVLVWFPLSAVKREYGGARLEKAFSGIDKASPTRQSLIKKWSQLVQTALFDGECGHIHLTRG